MTKLLFAAALWCGVALLISPVDAGRIKKGSLARTASAVCTLGTASVVFVAPVTEAILRVCNASFDITYVEVTLDVNSAALPDSGYQDTGGSCTGLDLLQEKRGQLPPNGARWFENVAPSQQRFLHLGPLVPGTEYILTIRGNTCISGSIPLTLPFELYESLCQ